MEKSFSSKIGVLLAAAGNEFLIGKLSFDSFIIILSDSSPIMQ